MNFDYKHIAIACLSTAIITALCMNSCNTSEVGHINTSGQKPDTVVQTDTFYTPEKIVYKWKTDTITVIEFMEQADEETKLTILKDYFSIREYNRMYEFGDNCFDLGFSVHQNEAHNINVSSTNVSQLPKIDKSNPVNFYVGTTYSFQPSSLNIALTIQSKNLQVYGSRSLNRNDWTVGVMKRLK